MVTTGFGCPFIWAPVGWTVIEPAISELPKFPLKFIEADFVQAIEIQLASNPVGRGFRDRKADQWLQQSHVRDH